jgi:hypothetical protein
VDGVALEHGDDWVVIKNVQKKIFFQIAGPNNATGIQLVEVNELDPQPHLWRQILRQAEKAATVDARPVQFKIGVRVILRARSGGHLSETNVSLFLEQRAILELS